MVVITKFLESIVDFLEKNVKRIFSYPGEQILPLYNEIENSSIKNVMVRDERGAGFMADGYARITNHVGVCLVTAGPGATNLTTPIATSYKDSSAVIAITGRCSRDKIGKNYFQEIDMSFLNFYKGYFVKEPNLKYFEEAFSLSFQNKKPVHLNIPKDVYEEFTIGEEINLNEMNNNNKDNDIVDKTFNWKTLINENEKFKKTLILIGQGIYGTLSYKEMEKISKFLKNVDIPIATTFPARGVINEKEENCVGLIGRRGVIKPLLEADSIINISSSLSFNTYPESIRKKLLSKTENIHLTPKNIKEIKEFFETLDLGEPWETEKWKRISPQGDYSTKINEIIENIPENSIIITDAGKHTVFTCLLKTCVVPRNIIASHSFGTMGFSVPVSIGVKFGTIDFGIDREVVSISGDGGFLMNVEELQVISEHNLKILMIVMKNNSLAEFCKIKNPDLNRLVDAFDIDNCYIESVEEIPQTIREYVKKDKPMLVVVETRDEKLPRPNI